MIDNTYLVISITLLLAGLSFLPEVLIFGTNSMFYLNYNSNKTLIIEKVHFDISLVSFCVFNVNYNFLLILAFLFKNKRLEQYISIMKRFKVYSGDYNKSHLNMMIKLLSYILIIVLLSKSLGSFYVILEDKYILKDIPSYKLFSIGFLTILTMAIVCLSSLGIIWIRDNIDQLLPEYTPIDTL